MSFIQLKNIVPIVFILSAGPVLSEARIQDVKTLMDEEKYVQAISLLDQMTSEDIASRVLVLNAKGWAYLKLGNYQEADKALIESYNLAMQRNDTESSVLASNNLGISTYLQNELGKSIEYFMHGKKHGSPTALTYLDLIEKKKNEIQFQEALLAGRQQRENSNFTEAVKNFDNALKVRPYDAKTLEFKGYALLRDGKVDSALETLKTARELNSGRLFVHLNLVKAYCISNSDDKVREVIEESLLPISQYKDWHLKDSEFRRMCEHSAYISNLIK